MAERSEPRLSTLPESGLVTVRPRHSNELGDCVQALREVYGHDGYPTRWPADPKRWISPTGLIAAWVAVDSGTICGHVALVAGVQNAQLVNASGRQAADLAAVSRLFVRPAYRGRRFGETLLDTVTLYATERGLGLVLDVIDENRSAAIALYERRGWQLVGLHPASWMTPDGARPQLRLYVRPSRSSS